MKKANSLIHEDSPYLLQHAYNPVEWLPWSEKSLQRAKEEQKPIFVSIGYSSCHWCHVMEHESFEDVGIAKILNEHFIAIKIDKEERVDIDKYFQEVYQLLNRRAGGWPLSIFLSHEQKPFYAGTYIPKAKIGKNIAFGELLEIIVDKYANERDNIIKNSNEIDSFMQKSDKQTKVIEFDKTIVGKMISEANFAFDEQFGGFSEAPKFPHSSILDILIDTYKLTQNIELLDKVTFTLEQMALGGLYDHVDGGWCRYSVDNKWLVPHFEKMGYDNGLLAEVYLKAYLVCKNPLFKTVALNSIEFMIAKMSQDNLFFSASDADSKGGEGVYFVYDLKTLHEVFKEDIEILDLPLGGNFEGEFIVRLKDIKDFDKLQKYTSQLRAIREVREYPAIDTKVQTSWSSMVIKSILVASLIDTKYKDIATKYIDALIEKMYSNGELYHSGLVSKTPKIKAYLEDYAYLIDLLLESYRLTQNEHHLILAQQLTSQALALFFDKGRWYLSVDEFKVEGEISDNSYPSSIALMTNNLQTLAALGEYKYNLFAKMSIEYYSKKINQNPLYFGLFVKAIYRNLFDDRVLKSNNVNLGNILLQIGNYNHPYILLQLTQNDTIEICGRQSCFNKVETVEEIKL